MQQWNPKNVRQQRKHRKSARNHLWLYARHSEQIELLSCRFLRKPYLDQSPSGGSIALPTTSCKAYWGQSKERSRARKLLNHKFVSFRFNKVVDKSTWNISCWLFSFVFSCYARFFFRSLKRFTSTNKVLRRRKEPSRGHLRRNLQISDMRSGNFGGLRMERRRDESKNNNLVHDMNIWEPFMVSPRRFHLAHNFSSIEAQAVLVADLKQFTLVVDMSNGVKF